jgi:hypothetical protein
MGLELALEGELGLLLEVPEAEEWKEPKVLLERTGCAALGFVALVGGRGV